MTATVHAAIGAGLGAFVKDPAKAFVAGVISHHFADRMPHREVPISLDVTAVVGFLVFLRFRYGGASPQLWGALGAIVPDFEHVLAKFGILGKHERYFTTHRNKGQLHGNEKVESDNQVLAAFLGGFLAEALSDGR